MSCYLLPLVLQLGSDGFPVQLHVRSHCFSYHQQGSLALDVGSLIPSSFVLSIILLVTILSIYCPVNHLQSGSSVLGGEVV